MQPTSPRDNIISTPVLVLAIIAAILGIAILSVSQAKSSIPNDAPIATQTTNAKPITSNLPEFNNFETLVNDGLTDDQLTGLQYAFGRFISSQGTRAKQVTIDKSTVVVVPRDRNSTSPTNVINFSVKIDDKSYGAEVDYSSLSPVQLKILNTTSGEGLFDSGVIDINKDQPTD